MTSAEESPVRPGAGLGGSTLRPVERVVTRLRQEGVDDHEIGRRFNRSPGMIQRIMAMAELPERAPAPEPAVRPLRAVERRVLRWREAGSDHDAIAARFRRGPAHIAQVERLANYKLRQQQTAAG
jgi:DNA-binding CsgD family transcriptional regulator